MTVLMFLAIVQIFGMFAVGWLARHLKYIGEDEINRWSRFVIDFLFPLLVFHSIVRHFEPDRLSELWPLPFIGLGMMVFGGLCGFVLRRGLKSSDVNLTKTFHHFCAVNNYVFLPIIIIQSIWGEPALAKFFFFNLGSTIGYWTIGVGLLGGEANVKKAIKNILSPTLVALFLALLLSMTGLSRFVPEVLLKISGSAGAIAVPLILILIGASMYPFPALHHKRDLAYLSLVRLAF